VLATVTRSDAEYKFHHFCVAGSNPENNATHAAQGLRKIFLRING
jgi:hypothetical protein